MAMLIRWQFDSCDFDPQAAFDHWWKDMQIESQMMCERAICHCGRGGSLIYFWHGEESFYKIDLIRMTQQNLNSGKVRLIRRTVLHGFHPEESFFENGKLKRKQPAVPAREGQNKYHRRKEKK